MDRRKIAMILGGAWLSAMLLTWFLWAQTKAPKTERMVKVVAAARDMQAGTLLRAADVRMVDVVEKDVPKTAIMDAKLALNRALLFPVNANDALTVSKLTTTTGTDGISSTIDSGKRAISVQITDASGVAGLITPRSKVDVLFTRSGSMTEAITNVILEDVSVMSIGRVTEVQTSVAAGAGTSTTPVAAAPKSQTTVATLLLSPEEAAKLELAKNQGKIGLALRNPLDRSTVGEKGLIMPEAIDPLVWTRGTKRRPGMPSPADLAKIKDPKEWARLTAGLDETPKPKPVVVEKKEPPKPRFIVDVFRGDKHVQESFQ
jgi:pilus assembly protein CpaB